MGWAIPEKKINGLSRCAQRPVRTIAKSLETIRTRLSNISCAPPARYEKEVYTANIMGSSSNVSRGYMPRSDDVARATNMVQFQTSPIMGIKLKADGLHELAFWGRFCTVEKNPLGLDDEPKNNFNLQ